MARPQSRHPTELELEILKIIWRDGPSPVRHVREALAAARDLAVTSVTTVMNIMIDKGYLARRKAGGVYVYRAVVGERATSRGMLADLVRRVFDGSRVAAAINLLGSRELDEEEIEQIRRFLDDRAKGRRK
jgi:predicted transcriptional regulator